MMLETVMTKGMCIMLEHFKKEIYLGEHHTIYPIVIHHDHTMISF